MHKPLHFYLKIQKIFSGQGVQPPPHTQTPLGKGTPLPMPHLFLASVHSTPALFGTLNSILSGSVGLPSENRMNHGCSLYCWTTLWMKICKHALCYWSKPITDAVYAAAASVQLPIERLKVKSPRTFIYHQTRTAAVYSSKWRTDQH